MRAGFGDVDLDHAALSEPLACCVHSVRNAKLQLGDDVVVIGAGIMGALHIQLAKMSGARVIVSELDEVRMEIARKMGADIVINAKETDAVAQVKELTEGRGADAVFCTVATSAVAKQAVDPGHKTLAIAHTNCPDRARKVKEIICSLIDVKDVYVVNTAGVSSTYAGDGGVIIAL